VVLREATYAVFARKLGMTPSSLFRLENGQQSITLKKLQIIMDRLPGWLGLESGSKTRAVRPCSFWGKATPGQFSCNHSRPKNACRSTPQHHSWFYCAPLTCGRICLSDSSSGLGGRICEVFCHRVLQNGQSLPSPPRPSIPTPQIVPVFQPKANFDLQLGGLGELL